MSTAAQRPPAAERLSIAGPGGVLEAVLEDPGAPNPSYAVVCHPHPLMGGTMDNKVVTTVARALQALGLPTLRFNFRGVGGSEGTYDQGEGETADADAIASWGAARWSTRTLVLAGFSFGSYIAWRLAQRRPAARLISIAPPVGRFDFSENAMPAIPWLIVQGDADEVVDPQAVISWAKGIDVQPRLVVLPGVGHFFHGRLQELRDAVTDFMQTG